MYHMCHLLISRKWKFSMTLVLVIWSYTQENRHRHIPHYSIWTSCRCCCSNIRCNSSGCSRCVISSRHSSRCNSSSSSSSSISRYCLLIFCIVILVSAAIMKQKQLLLLAMMMMYSHWWRWWWWLLLIVM